MAIAALCGCRVDIDYGGTRFQCAEQPVCPAGLVCVDGECVTPGGNADAGPTGDAAPRGPFRRALTVTATLAEPLNDAPVLIRLTPDRIDYALFAADGSDIRFALADDTPLPHEIERWEPGGESLVWVELPVLETGAAFSMIYGDGAADSQRPAEVWSRYDLVYHFAGSGADSRSGLEATPIGGATHGAGRLGEGAALDGVDDYFEIGQSLPLLRGAGGATASAWIRTEVLSGSILEVSIDSGPPSRMFLSMQTDGTMTLGVRTQDLAEGSQSATSLDALGAGEWSWVVGTADLAAQTIVVYIDGLESGRAEMLATDPVMPDTDVAIAVMGADDGLASGFFSGALDEVRCASTSFDAAWVEAQYLSMTDALLSLGDREPL
jgi:hypothetical protein